MAFCWDSSDRSPPFAHDASMHINKLHAGLICNCSRTPALQVMHLSFAHICFVGNLLERHVRRSKFIDDVCPVHGPHSIWCMFVLAKSFCRNMLRKCS